MVFDQLFLTKLKFNYWTLITCFSNVCSVWPSCLFQVAIFLKQTLSRFKLYEILATRPTVTNHLVSYLTKRKAFQEINDLLTASGRYEEAALIAYRSIIFGKSLLRTILSKNLNEILHDSKGQLISEWLLDVFVWTKKRTKIFLYFCPTSLK